MRKTFACTLSAVLIAGLLAAPVAGYADDAKDNELQTVTISVEDLEALATGGDYLTSPTDGVGMGQIDAELISKWEVRDGGYTAAKTPKLTKTRRKIFKKAMNGFVGSDITPVAYLASQVVAGTNHRYLCRIKAVVPDAKEYYAFVTVYEDLEGNASITDIKDTGIVTNINELPGGWFQASNVKVTKSIKKSMNKALEGLVGVDYKPVAVLAEQVVAGMNYCVLCESKVVYPGAATGYSLVYMYVGFDGSASINDIVKIEEGSSDELEGIGLIDAEHSMKTLIVSVDENASAKKLKKIFKKFGFSILYDYDNFNMYAITLAEDTTEENLNDLIAKLEAYDEILAVEKDYIYHTYD